MDGLPPLRTDDETVVVAPLPDHLPQTLFLLSPVLPCPLLAAAVVVVMMKKMRMTRQKTKKRQKVVVVVVVAGVLVAGEQVAQYAWTSDTGIEGELFLLLTEEGTGWGVPLPTLVGPPLGLIPRIFLSFPPL